jgi:YgiT-type zinc finger domain-containing protein
MAGVISLADIETVIKVGEVVENQTPSSREGSVLIQGQMNDRSLFLLVSRASDGCLVIALTYLIPYPTWPQLLCAELTLGHQMENPFRSCFFCGGDIKPITVGNFDYRYEGALYVIKNTPAGLCLKCGEKYVTAKTAEQINSLIAAGQFQGTEAVRVLPYQKEG